ncbi:hypothetical protein [Terrarubrum flagellatum]|uniref:hypothetical protein n=1 Tax=Terrirubrum flagellatum TaxID=2895980 RepID=UPI003144F976
MPTAASSQSAPRERRLLLVAGIASIGVLALAGLAWALNADAVLVELANAALAMCL